MNPHRKRIARYLDQWLRYDNNDLLGCAAIIATYRKEHEFFTWAVRWLTLKWYY